MSASRFYRRIPYYAAAPLALLVSAIAALTLAVLGAAALCFLLDRFHQPGNLGDAILPWFYVASSLAVLGFVFLSSILINLHRATSWRVPALAFTLSPLLVWVWARDFGGIGFAWYVPGAAAWLLSCWYLHRNAAHCQHVLEA